MTAITIGIPVGPYRHHKRFLREAYESARAADPDCILIVDDMADVTPGDLGRPDDRWISAKVGPNLTGYSTLFNAPRTRRFLLPWRTGVAGAFNACVGASPFEYVLMLGADDELFPNAVEQARLAIDGCKAHYGVDPGGVYWSLPIVYGDTGEEQSAACNAAVVSKTLWRLTGGFPPEAGSGAPDAALLSILIATKGEAGQIIGVGTSPLYRYRRHADTDTGTRGPWQGVILQTRDLLSQLWKPEPRWGR